MSRPPVEATRLTPSEMFGGDNKWAPLRLMGSQYPQLNQNEPPATLTVVAQTSALARVRRHVADTLRLHGADEAVVADFELAVSELATNVMQHTLSSTVVVAVSAESSRWLLVVADAAEIPDLALSRGPMPTADDVSGRGLFIVQALMDEVEIVDRDGAQLLRCVKHRA